MTGSFHFFDDGTEWLGMDKLGHLITSFVETWIFIEVYFFISGTDHKSLKWVEFMLVGLAGFWLQLPIEVLDGFSAGYGFSIFDLMANFTGASFAFWQFSTKGRLYIFPKFSFYPSNWALLRPELLGYNLPQQFVKDYNSQIYWISFHPGYKLFPDWLNIAVGYGADGLLGGHDNIWGIFNYSNIARQPQFYLSLDIDISKLPITNRTLKRSLLVFNVIKFPLPMIEISEIFFGLHWIKL